MSLKAKIEAVIYASEEPVTLAQLIGLLGQEAQAELDHLDARQQSLDLSADDEPVGPNSVEPEPTDEAPSQEPQPTDESPLPELSAPEQSTEHHLQHDASPESPLTPPSEQAPQPAPEQDSRQADRLRERKLREYFRSLLDQLIAEYTTSERGLEIREIAGGFRLGTKPEYHDTVRGFVKRLKPPLKLSLQALETLAVIAYKQPVTAPEISEIRGVDSAGVLGSLMARKLITTAGRKHVIGRPILYKTTRDFLLRFGLKDVSELPSIEEFEKMASELADIDSVQEEIPMALQTTETTAASVREEERRLAELVEPEKDAHEPQADGTDVPLEGSDESSSGSPDLTVVGTTRDAHPDLIVKTPEGDNEFAPDQPLEPLPVAPLRTPAIDTNKV